MQTKDLLKTDPGIKPLSKSSRGRVHNLGSGGEVGLDWRNGQVRVTVNGVSVVIRASEFDQAFKNKLKVNILHGEGHLALVWEKNLEDGDRIYMLDLKSHSGKTAKAYVSKENMLWYLRVM